VPSSNQWIIAQPTPCLLLDLSRIKGRSFPHVSRFGRQPAKHNARGVRARIGGKRGEFLISGRTRLLQANPEELLNPRRQIEGDSVTGHV
jgi:hypothetical protein